MGLVRLRPAGRRRRVRGWGRRLSVGLNLGLGWRRVVSLGRLGGVLVGFGGGLLGGLAMSVGRAPFGGGALGRFIGLGLAAGGGLSLVLRPRLICGRDRALPFGLARSFGGEAALVGGLVASLHRRARR